jgi:hypothetical protein
MREITLPAQFTLFLNVNYPCFARFMANMEILRLYRVGFAGYTRAATGRSAQFDRRRYRSLLDAQFDRLILFDRYREAQHERRDLLGRYRSGALGLKPLLKIAMKTFDDKNLELFLKSLFRKEKPRKTETEVGIDVAICYLDQTEKLTLRTAEDASKRVTSYVHERGEQYKFSAAAYRKRIERLRRKGVMLLCV